MLDAMTWISIAVLIGGSLVVFIWFLLDAARLLGEETGEDRGEA